MSTWTGLKLHIPRVTQPLHAAFPFPLIDIFGAMRLSSVVNWIATGALDPPASKRVNQTRASLLQEMLGLMVVVFGGETFLCMLIVYCGLVPAWYSLLRF